jgi:thiamine biosynthesis protein ThiS
MEIVLNGNAHSVARGATVLELLEALRNEVSLDPARVAVERNRAIVRRTEWAATALEAGDRIEVVQFVGGG